MKLRTISAETLLPVIAVTTISATVASLVTWKYMKVGQVDNKSTDGTEPETERKSSENENDGDKNSQNRSITDNEIQPPKETSSSIHNVHSAREEPTEGRRDSENGNDITVEQVKIPVISKNANKKKTTPSLPSLPPSSLSPPSKEGVNTNKKKNNKNKIAKKDASQVHNSTKTRSEDPTVLQHTSTNKKVTKGGSSLNMTGSTSNEMKPKSAQSQQPCATTAKVNKSGNKSSSDAVPKGTVASVSDELTPSVSPLINQNKLMITPLDVPTVSKEKDTPLSWIVFWDVENVTKPHDMPVWKFVRAIRMYVSKARRLHKIINNNNSLKNTSDKDVDVNDDTILRITVVTDVNRLSGDLPAELHSNGVAVMHVQSSTRKDVADKSLLTDICLLPYSYSPKLYGVALLSGDVDFSYAMSKLTALGYCTLVIARDNSFSPLLACAPKIIASLSQALKYADGMKINGREFTAKIEERLRGSKGNWKQPFNRLNTRLLTSGGRRASRKTERVHANSDAINQVFVTGEEANGDDVVRRNDAGSPTSLRSGVRRNRRSGRRDSVNTDREARHYGAVSGRRNGVDTLTNEIWRREGKRSILRKIFNLMFVVLVTLLALMFYLAMFGAVFSAI